MKRLFQALTVFVGIWVLGSFLGVMFDPARANIWTQSLMWAMLASVILAPVFIFYSTASSDATAAAPSRRSQQVEGAFDLNEDMEVNQQTDPRETEGWPYSTS